MDNEVDSRNQKLDNPKNHSCTHDTNFDTETNFVDVTQMIQGENLTDNMEEQVHENIHEEMEKEM